MDQGEQVCSATNNPSLEDPVMVLHAGTAAVVLRRDLLMQANRLICHPHEARALSTRHLYAQKWVVISGWCASRSLDPYLCEVSSILTFLQGSLDVGRTPSTFKMYVALIRGSLQST